jgi:hypothetical protein
MGEDEGLIMMFSCRLVRLIESHADALTGGVEKNVQASSQVAHFRDTPAHELRERAYEIYRHLGEWRLGNNPVDIEHGDREIGARLARQHVPLSEIVQGPCTQPRDPVGVPSKRGGDKPIRRDHG